MTVVLFNDDETVGNYLVARQEGVRLVPDLDSFRVLGNESIEFFRLLPVRRCAAVPGVSTVDFVDRILSGALASVPTK